MRGFVRAVDGHAQVGGLRRGELGELGAERAEVQPRDLLVEVLGQRVDLLLVVVGMPEQLIWAITWLVNEFDITKLG